jgi:hypothetical protein
LTADIDKSSIILKKIKTFLIMEKSSEATTAPHYSFLSDAQILIGDIYLFRNRIRDLMGDNNNLKTRLSSLLDREDAEPLLEEAEEFQNLFMTYEEQLMNLCARSRRQLVRLLQMTDSFNPQYKRVSETQQELSRILLELDGKIRHTRNAFELRFGGTRQLNP